MRIEVYMTDLYKIQQLVLEKDYEEAQSVIAKIIHKEHHLNTWRMIFEKLQANVKNKDKIREDYLEGLELGKSADESRYPISGDEENKAYRLGFHRGRLDWPEPDKP